MNFSTNFKISKVADYSAAGTTAVNTTAVDMQSWDGVFFLTHIGTANAGNFVNAAQGEQSDGSDAADLSDTKVTATADNETVWLEICKPTKRYVRLEATRGVSTTLGAVYAIQYEGLQLPPVNVVVDTIIGELHVTPEEGTA